MKLVILLYLLATLCKIQLTDAGGDANYGYGVDPYKKFVRETRIDLKNLITQLKSERIKTRDQIEETLEKIEKDTQQIWKQNMAKVNGQLQKSFAIAAANGKNVEICIKNAESFVEDIESVLNPEFEKCINSIKSNYNNHEYLSSDIQEDTMEIYDQLNNIIPACEDVSRRHECISQKVGSINLRVTQLNERFQSHFDYYNNALDDGYRLGQTCVRKCRDDANQLITRMIEAADECVDNE